MLRLLLLSTAVLCLTLIGLELHVLADEKLGNITRQCTVYEQDPNHIANRLHAALFVRIGPDSRQYGVDRLEPLLWANSRYLLDGEHAGRAIAMLKAFLDCRGERELDSNLKRAILQRDLWLVANWLIRQDQKESGQLLELAATAISRLALTPDQIARLPDNYAAAVASKQFADRFDPDHRNRSYLPPDLFTPSGPWVCVGRTDGRTAPAHLGASHHITPRGDQNPFTNSTFFVFLKLPGGREDGLKFVEELRQQKRPFFIRSVQHDGKITSEANLELPSLPIGSEMALVRRAMLIDSSGTVRPTALTEDVQLRITTSSTIMHEDGGGLREDPKRAAALEFELRRLDLFADRAGGLRDTSAEHDFLTGFFASPNDEFELDRRPNSERFYPLPRFEEAALQVRRQLCFGCHGVSTLYGTRSFHRTVLNDEVLKENSLPIYPIAVMSPGGVERQAVGWKTSHPDLAALKRLLVR